MCKEQTLLKYLEKLQRHTGWKYDLSLYGQVHAVKSLFTDEMEPYLTAKAALETNLKIDHIDKAAYVYS